MKRHVLSILLLLLVGNSFGQIITRNDTIPWIRPTLDKNPEFYVEIGNCITIVPSATTERQCQFIAFRSVHPLDGELFDTTFFNKAIKILEEKYPVSEVKSLKLWGSKIVSSKGIIVFKEEYIRFIKQSTTDYNLKINELLVTDDYDLIQIGEITIQVIKKSCGSGKKKIEIKDGYYYIKPSKDTAT